MPIISTEELMGSGKNTISTEDLMGGIKPKPKLKDIGNTNQWLEDVIAPSAHFANQFAANIPRALANKMGWEYPEAKGAANILAKGAGVVGGVMSPLNKLAALKLLKGAPLASKMLSGALAAGAYTPTEDLLGIPQRLGQAAFGAAIPVAGRTAGKVGEIIGKKSSAGQWIERNVGGIRDWTVKTIKDIGAKKVFSPEYASEDYVGKVFAPKVTDMILKEVDNIGPATKDKFLATGASLDEFNALSKVSKNSRKTFTGLIKQGMNPQEASEALLQDAKTTYSDIIDKANTPINITNTFKKIKATLIKNNWATEDAGGMLQSKTVLGGPNSARDNLIKTWNFMRLKGQVSINPRTKQLNKILTGGADFQTGLYELEGYLTGDPKRDRVILDVITSLRNDAKDVRTGIVGLKRVSELWSDAKILKDLSPKLSKMTDPVRINTAFGSITSETAAKRYQLLERMKLALGKELYEDIASHYASRNYDPSFFPSRSGLARVIVKEIAKRTHLREAQPPSKLSQGIQNLGQNIGQKAQSLRQSATEFVENPASILKKTLN